MKSIKFNIGFEEYEINGTIVRIGVNDLNIGKRVQDMFSELKKIQEKYPDTDAPTPEQISEVDTDIRRIINGTFGADVCTPAFGDVHCCSPVGDGKVLFESFLEEFTPIFMADLQKYAPVQHEIRPEVRKYLPETSEESAMPDVNAMSKEQKAQLIAQLLS